MTNLHCPIAATILLALCVAASISFADEPAPPPKQPAREIFVPFADLHILLENQPKRILLGREEYNDLVKKAKKSPDVHAPLAALIVSADYALTAAAQRAEIQGTLAIEVLETGLHALPLDIGSVGLQSATLDGRSASIGRADNGQLLLFVEGVGQHKLVLDMVAPLETTAARQVLNFRLPRPAAAKLRLNVAGDVEIKGGADVISRTVDAAAKVTRFELLPHVGDTSLVMTLNSHLQQQDRAVVARSVLVDEITQAYEKLYATVSMGVLYRAVDQFRFVVPEGFEITDVTSPLLARWDVQTEAGRKVLGVKLREQTTETVVLNIAAIRTPAKLENWTAPRLEPLDVVGSAAVFGLLVEDRLKAESLTARGLIPIETTVLGDILPAALAGAGPNQLSLRAVAAWYAPQSDFSLTAQYKKPPAELAVTTSLLLVVADKGQEILGGLSFLPQVERRFSFDVFVPAGWQVASVTSAAGQPLPFDRYADSQPTNPGPKAEQADTASRIRVTVPGGMPIGQEFKANFRAVRTPPGWMAEWKSVPIEFPKFAVLDATRTEGAIAVDVRDDLDVRPDKIKLLTPLDAAEKPKYGLADVSTRLAYRYESPDYAAALVVDRTRPRLTARTLSFVRVEPSELRCHYELIYTIEEARTQRLAFSLPKDTPASLSITALDGVKLKEFTPEIVGELRRWNVSLVESTRDRVRIAVDFRQPLPARQLTGHVLPIVVADNVAYQSGLVAVEGCAELEVKVNTSARAVDVGELADADYQPGRRLLGAYGFVGDPPPVKLDVLRHPAYTIYPAIVQQCQLDTNLSPEGQSQTRARFQLVTKSLFLQIKLPPNAELWSAELDGVTLKPQHEGDSVLIDVPAGTSAAPQLLQLVYAAPVDSVSLRGTVTVPAPKLLLRAEQKATAAEVPLADLVWRLHLPNGYEAVASNGTVATDDIPRPAPAAIELAHFLFNCNRNLSQHSPLAAVSREAGRDNRVRSIGLAVRNYGEQNKLFPPSVQYPDVKTEPKSDVDALYTPSRRSAIRAVELERVIAQKKAELEAKRAQLNALVGTDSGSAEPETLRNEVTIAMHDLAAYQQQAAKVQAALDAARADLAKKEAANPSPPVTGDFAAAQQPVLEVARGRALVRSLEAEAAALQKQLAEKRSQSVKLGQTSVDPEMLRSDLKRLDTVVAQLENERNKAGGIKSVDRASIPFDDKSPVVFPDKEKWGELTTKRTKTNTTGGTEALRHDGEKAGGSQLAEPYYSKDDVQYKPLQVGMSAPGALSRQLDISVVNDEIRGRDLTGTRSLKIDVLQSPSGADQVLSFYSLGVEPQLVVTLANRSRLSSLGWGLALLVGLFGLAITRRPVRNKSLFILAVAVLATIVPLATGSIEIARVCNMLFYAACLLVLYYLAVGIARALLALGRRLCAGCAAKPVCPAPAAKSTAAVLLILGLIGSAHAQPATNPPSGGAPYVIQVVEPAAPVIVPDDAVILPYDPDWRNGSKDADRVLVPYDRYVELWNAVHPDKRIETKAPPAASALGGATYKTLLEGDEYLLVTGQLEIDVFTDGFVEIPLGLGGGVLAQAELDGKPARLRVANAVPPASQQPNVPQMSKPQAAAPDNVPDRSLIVLYVSGKGRHKLDLSVRLKLSRQGGWRVVQAVLPAAPASSLAITVPKQGTELRLGQVLDRRKYDTERPNETIRTALGLGGALSIEWRPTVADGQTDHSLTAVSAAVLDAQEDGLRLVWQLGLEFRRSQRERFNVNLPAGYLLEKVEGNNVRGWELHKRGDTQTVEVTLLQPAKDYEKFTLRLWRAGAVGQAKLADFDVPQVTIADAALHTGQLTLRRSPLLELRTVNRSGVTRTDLPPADAATAAGSAEQPLVIQPFEAYTFAAVPFTLRLAAAPVVARVSANVQTVLKLAEFERLLESHVTFDVQNRSAYQLRMLLPDNLRVDHVSAPGAFHYAVTKQDGHPLLTIYLAAGQQGEVPVVVRGRLGREKTITELPLPRLQVLDVDRQQGDIAVQVDPAFDVDAVGLTNCESVLLDQLAGWLNPAQLRGTRLGLHYRQADYAATLRLRLRKPEVACDTITNVRLTDRALEETIFLNFTITNAGIRKLSFLLPAEMADSRVSVLMPRQKPSIEPIGKEPNSPLRITVELQDEVMGNLRVIVENDRLLATRSYDAPIPIIEKGDRRAYPEQTGIAPSFRMGRRYVVIENAGRDEVVIEPDKRREMDSLGARQKEWEMLKGILGREMTMAYLVAPDAQQPRLAFHTESHAAVTTVKARIVLAETTLKIDDNGAYRAQQTYHMDNATEQFLEILLPEGAELWTARVAGEAVKPTKLPGAANAGSVHIPIIKTAPGDLYYNVVLKYGGAMPPLGSLGVVRFPLIRCINIAPDLSHVRLLVPRDQRWFDFGGTMRHVTEEAELQAEFVKLQTKQAEQNTVALRQGDKWTKARAEVNGKVLQSQIYEYRSKLSSATMNPTLQSELAANDMAVRQATEEATKQEQAPAEQTIQDNRQRLDAAFQAQKTNRARNVVNDLGNNWTDVNPPPTKGYQPEATAQRFNNDWMVQNKLAAGEGLARDEAVEKKPADQSGKDGVMIGARGMPKESGYVVVDGQIVARARVRVLDESEGREQVRRQPSAAQVVQNPARETMQGKLQLGVGVNSDAGVVGSIALGQPQTSQGGQYAQTTQNDAQTQQRYIDRLNVQAGLAPSDPYGRPSTPPAPPAAGAQLNRIAGPAPAEPSAAAELWNNRPADVPGMPPMATPATPQPAACVPPSTARRELALLDVNTAKKDDVCYTICKPTYETKTKAVQQAAAGLASLDVDLFAGDDPHFKLYCFKTPLGSQEITARNASNDLVRRLVEIVIVAAVLLLACFVAAMIRRGAFSRLARPLTATLLICLGVLSLCAGLLPLLGLIALLTGCALLIHCWTSSPTPAV